MTALLTLVLGLVAIWIVVTVSVVTVAVWFYARDVRDARRRMTAPRAQREVAPDSDDIWAELERVLHRSRSAA
jgi:cytochrome c-type biogenesis protein CcmH/NrfG